jgi:hypothetical protein
MKPFSKKIKRTIVLLVCFIFLAVALIILFISPITKYWVEKNDEKYTGRKITMDWAYVNPFTGYVYFSNVKIFELHSDSVMLSSAGLSGKFSMRKMLSGYYEISELIFDHPVGNIIKHEKDFNFMTFVKAFEPEHPDTTGVPGNFNILKIKIEEGEFHYLQEEIPVTYFIKGANIESEGKLFDADSVLFKFFFLSGPGTGSIEGTYVVNFKNKDYQYNIRVRHFDLTPIEQYLKALANYGTFRANMDADLISSGNFKNAEDVTTKGQLVINDFHVGKNRDEDYASFDKLVFAIEELSPVNKKYIFDSIALYHPVIKYEQYDRLDNVQMMFGEAAANLEAAAKDPERFNLIIEIAHYTKELARNFFQSYYKIKKLSVEKADLRYNDYTLNEKFATAISPLTIRADSIDKNYKRTNVSFKSGIKPFGNFTIDLSINPRDTGDFDMQYDFQKIPATMFNPYIISYTSFPLDRGTIELKGSWMVRKGNIQSENHFLLIDPRVTKRIKNKNTKWIPLPLIMSFVRDYGNVIDYEIPITGSLKNPKFHLKDVIFGILGNIFIKPVTTPYRMEVKHLETEIEKSLTLTWAMRQTELHSEQEKFVKKIAGFLEENPKATIVVLPHEYAIKEKEYILFYEAKKKYFLSSSRKDAQSFSEDDSEKVNKMSVKDSLFVKYLDKHNKDTMLFTIQEKCSKLIGSKIVNARFNQLTADRKNNFMSYFKEKNVADRVEIRSPENTIPYNGFSFYKIKYQGEIPESLLKAYRKLQELNDEAPRKKYERPQRKIK